MCDVGANVRMYSSEVQVHVHVYTDPPSQFSRLLCVCTFVTCDSLRLCARGREEVVSLRGCGGRVGEEEMCVVGGVCVVEVCVVEVSTFSTEAAPSLGPLSQRTKTVFP